MTDAWITERECASHIRTRIGGSVGRSEAIFKTALSTGEIRKRIVGQVLLAADDGIVDRRRPAAPETRFSEDDLIDWLDRHHPATTGGERKSPTVRRGRRPAADWEAVELALRDEVNRRGFPEADNDDPLWRIQADVERWIADVLAERKESVQESTIRERTRQILGSIKAGN